jgi:hypothetical protein
LGADVASSTLVIGENGSILANEEGLVDLLRGGQGVFNIVPMAGVVAQLETSLAGEPAARATA